MLDHNGFVFVIPTDAFMQKGDTFQLEFGSPCVPRIVRLLECFCISSNETFDEDDIIYVDIFSRQ